MVISSPVFSWFPGVTQNDVFIDKSCGSLTTDIFRTSKDKSADRCKSYRICFRDFTITLGVTSGIIIAIIR